MIKKTPSGQGRQGDALKSKRIFVGFNSAGAAGIYAYTRVLRGRGHQIDFYGMNKTYFDMPVDFLLKFSSNTWVSFFQRIKYFFKILFRYDIWHFNFMEVFFFYPLNLAILKLLGKKIVLTFRGIDVQTDLEFLPRSIYSKSSKWPEYYHLQLSLTSSLSILLKKIRRKVFVFFADKIVLTGPFLAGQVSEYDKIIPYARDLKTGNNSLKPVTKKIVILHIPSDPVVKGTAEISRVFKKMAKKYPKHSFKVLPSLPREKLLSEIAKADIVVDQIIIGWYGGQAVEAMSQGKIVMAFLNPAYMQLVNFGREIPIWNTNIWSLEKDLETLIKVYSYIVEDWQKVSQEFVVKYHDSRKIANQYLEIYQGCYDE